ncbi:MAG: type II secretion system F family protein [archaeon]
MRLSDSIYILFSNFLPERIILDFKQKLDYLGLDINPRLFSGAILFFSFGLDVLILLLLSFYLPVIFFLFLAPVLFGIFFFLSLSLIDYAIDMRAKAIESVLPDALLLLASNIKAGMTLDKAFFFSARPEFGILRDEFNRMGEQMLLGERLDEIVKSFSKRVRSSRIQKLSTLISESVQAGGEFSQLLEALANDIQVAEGLKKEIQANVSAYILFVIFGAVIAAPFFYGISSGFIEMTEVIKQKTGVSTTQLQIPVSFFATTIDSSLLFIFCISALAISSIFASFIVGILKEGEESFGYSYLPIFILTSLALFLLSKIALSLLFHSFFLT